MSHILYVEYHPLGVVVHNEANNRELLIEGETCCSISFEELKRIAESTRKVEIDEAQAVSCRLFRPSL
jgi:hypothetical protein